MKLILLLASICAGLTGVSAEVETTDRNFYNLWCDPAYEDECYFVEESCNPETDMDFNCEYHPALFVEDDVDPDVHPSITQLYYIWCEPSDEDECYFVNEPCDPENESDNCEYHPAIFTESDLEEMEEEAMDMDGDGRKLRRGRNRHHRYRRYRRRNRHRYRRHRRHGRYYGKYP